MEFLYTLEKLRLPGINEFMLAITYLGDEIAFLVTAMIVFWCVDKRRGYYVLSVGFIGTLVNQVMKLWFRVPRPWVLDEKFTILEQAREGAVHPLDHGLSLVLAVKCAVLRQNAHRLAAREINLTRGWLSFTCKQAQERGLAATGGTHNRHILPRLDFKRQIIKHKRHILPVTERHVIDLNRAGDAVDCRFSML